MTLSAAEALETAVAMLRRQLPELWAVYLYGSFDTPYQRPESDLDLAIICAAPVAPLPLWELAQQVASAIGRDVQIVDLRQASTVLQKEIINNERRLFCCRPTECDLLETAYLSMYLHLNEARREILDDFRRQSSN